MVPLRRIELPTPSLPMTCSTSELQRHISKMASKARARCHKAFYQARALVRQLSFYTLGRIVKVHAGAFGAGDEP